MKKKNTLYKALEWKSATPSHIAGICTELDASVYLLESLWIVPITPNEQRVIDRYDVSQKPGDTVVFYAAWAEGEWQPRATYPDYGTAKADVARWWWEYTNDLSPEPEFE